MNRPMPTIITGEQYVKYHPGQVELTSKDEEWKGLLFTRYSHPTHCDGCPRPATSDHILAFSNNGAVKGQYSFNGSKFKPYTWRQSEWLIGQAYQNSRDSRWDTLCDEDEELSVCYIHLSPKVLEKVALEAGDKTPREIELPHKMSFCDPFMFQLGMELKAEAEQASIYGKVFSETAANILAVHLLKKYSAQPVKVEEYKTNSRLPWLQTVLEYINDSLAEELSLELMAQLAHLSVYHFARSFKQAVGVAPHQYIMLARINKAKNLLKHTDMPITIIALEVGYSLNHFIQAFKRINGKTPNQYRNSFK